MASPVENASAESLRVSESSMCAPTVSFVVLCYRLAHLLPECINSILSQTYRDFEVLIMDDQSPDNTADVAKSFRDPRVKYVLNEKNLGVLRNENEGVRLSRGKYVWIISADDYLRRPYILQRYVELMEENSGVGFTCCSGVGVREGREVGVLSYSKYDDRDGVFDGRVFLSKLLCGNFVLAPSVLVRRECYDKISLYPLELVWGDLNVDMVWTADWYLWCLFALSFDVAYFAEPMVCYREHDLSISSSLAQQNLKLCVTSDIATRWLIKEKADERGLRNLSKACLRAIASGYASHVAKRYRGSTSRMSVSEFEESVCRGTKSERERNWIRARFYASKGDASFHEGNIPAARKFYRKSLQKDPLMVKVYAKLFFSLGKLGPYLRTLLGSVRKDTTSSVPESSSIKS
jgi:glycosyltransferase involved in cell wall biosynthesis